MYNIPRYINPCSSDFMEHTCGEWVKYVDHKARIQELEEQLHIANQTIYGDFIENTQLESRVQELETEKKELMELFEKYAGDIYGGKTFIVQVDMTLDEYLAKLREGEGE